MKNRISSDRQQNLMEEKKEDHGEVLKDRKKMEWRELLQESKDPRVDDEEGRYENNQKKRRTSDSRDINKRKLPSRNSSNYPLSATTKFRYHSGSTASHEASNFASATIETVDHFLQTEAFEHALDLNIQQQPLLGTSHNAPTTSTLSPSRRAAESPTQYSADGVKENNTSTKLMESSRKKFSALSQPHMTRQELNLPSDNTADKVREIINNQSSVSHTHSETPSRNISSLLYKSPQRARTSFMDDDHSNIQDQSISSSVSGNLKASRLQQIYDKVTNKGKGYISK
jgi:hypothetical protein